jgi:phosphoenolpyruvate---glycerone phosphotransferase subunit DhaL
VVVAIFSKDEFKHSPKKTLARRARHHTIRPAMPKTALNKDEVKAMLLLVAERIIAAEPELSEADRNLGDGDHGLGMQRGMTAAKDKLNATDAESIEKAFSSVGMAMMSSMGGASGAIFGTFFRNGGKALAGKDALDAAGLAAFFRAGVEGVKQRGGAAVGDKTVVDAMEPAAVKAEEVTSASLSDAITAIAAAAEAGKEASKALVAKFGRAKTLGEACIGFPDAGALSVTVIVNAMRDYVLE